MPYDRIPQIDDDAVEVIGLAALLEDDPPPFLEIVLKCTGAMYHATILPVESEWAVTVRDERGSVLTADAELFPTQSGALLAAMLIAHEAPVSE